MAASIKTKEREKARIADTMPLESAVNKLLAKILNPMKNRANVQSRFPDTARLYTGSLGRANTPTRGFVKRNESVTVKTEMQAMTRKLSEAS